MYKFIIPIILIILVLLVLAKNIVIVQQSRAYVVERLGAFQAVWGVGIHLKIPFIERVARKVSLKEQIADFPPQPVITKDNVTIQVDTVLFFQITDPKLYAYGVEHPMAAIENLTATTLRKKGYKDSSAYVQAAKSTWNEAQAAIQGYQKLAKYTDEDIRILTTTVFHEAGHTTEQLRQYVAQVVLNRVKDSRFPSTVKAVITQPGQYATKYADASTTQSVKSKDAANGTYYYAMCENAVKTAMMGQVNMPSNVLYQANFSQGKGVWKSVSFNSGWYSSTSYFCYG